MEQEIRFCTTGDGARIAYATVGQGPPVVWPPWLISNLELDWEDPERRAFLEALARHHTLVRYDRWGCGLSERERTDFSLEAEVRCLESVVDHLNLRRFALFGGSQAGPPSIAYTAKHPRRVSRLVLYATFGRRVPEEGELRDAINALMRAHWGLGSQVMADRVLPGAGPEYLQRWARYQREAATPDMAVSLRNFLRAEGDIRDLCGLIRIPTLVLHRRGDGTVPFERGREVAAAIPKARFVPLEGQWHAAWMGDADSVLQPILDFLAGKSAQSLGTSTTPPGPAKAGDIADEKAAAAAAARTLIAGLDTVALSHYWVVPGYVRHDETVRQALKDARQAITAGLHTTARKRENHLLWAPPGSGKTYLVQRVAASLADSAMYCELNLAGNPKEDFVGRLQQLDPRRPCLCFVDEVDARPGETWPYEVLLPALDANAAQDARLVFILAGSSGTSLADMKERIAARQKGADLLSRVPAANEHVVPPMSVGDRVLAALA